MKYRPQWTLLSLGAVIVLLLFTYPQWRKFLVIRGGPGTVFPAASDIQRDQLLKMSKDDGAGAATAYVAMLTAIPAPTNELPTPVLPDAQSILSGEFIEIDPIHTAKGKVTLYRRADETLLLRFDDFSVTNAPALYVYLCAISAPKKSDELLSGPYFKVGAVKGSVGGQQFSIPKELNLKTYRSVVLYSEALTSIYSTAPLR